MLVAIGLEVRQYSFPFLFTKTCLVNEGLEETHDALEYVVVVVETELVVVLAGEVGAGLVVVVVVL